MYIPIGGKVYKFQRGLVYLYKKYMEESIPMSIEALIPHLDLSRIEHRGFTDRTVLISFLSVELLSPTSDCSLRKKRKVRGWIGSF